MKRKIPYISFVILSLLLLACSNKKNTWLSRNSQALNTRYNVYFNGNESYKEGLDNIRKANIDDYSQILPLYPISKHENAEAATAQMDRAIEKCEKAIKLHTLRVKPKNDPARRKDPKYQAFLKKEEYNTQMDEVWMLFGKAQFHKADFLAAMSSFTYITNHFKDNKSAIVEAKIWKARCYSEMGWYFEAEDLLKKTNKNQVSKSLTALFSSTKADLLLKQAKYIDAIPFLTIAAANESDRKQKMRSNYVLAQLEQLNGNSERAIYLYDKVKRANPPYEMAFNARVNREEVDVKHVDKAIKKLKRMLRNTKYKENKDKIYYTIGRIYYKQGDDKKAIENYLLAIENSVNDGSDKIQVMVALADLYYKKSLYIEAQPQYASASTLMSIEHVDYERVSKRSQLLGELSQQNQIVVLQDSLQALAALSDFQQKEKINALIKSLQAEEEALKKQLEAEIYSQSNMQADELDASIANLTNTQGNWYFYNNMLIAGGKSDFKRRWGARQLEDNWRRKNKASVDFEELAEADELAEILNENPDAKVVTKAGSSVNTNVDFYLKQLPLTQDELENSNKQIAEALYNMGLMYKEDLSDVPMAIKTFEELERRFPTDTRLADVYYYLYQMNVKSENESQAEYYRNQLIQRFPESTYAQALSQPDYVARMTQMNLVQDSLYQEAYVAYTKSDYNAVFASYKTIKQEYPLTPLMPKFMFVDALSQGKAGNVAQLKIELESVIADYPKSDVVFMAKDILALMNQGNEVQQGSSHGSMLNLRDSAVVKLGASDTVKFSSEEHTRHLVVIRAPKDMNMNKLQFNVASFNFTGFMVKNFDLEIIKNKSYNLLVISALDDFEEAEWYLSSLKSEKDVYKDLNRYTCSSFVISDENMDLLRKGRSVDEYLEFYNNELAISLSNDEDIPSESPSIDNQEIAVPDIVTDALIDSNALIQSELLDSVPVKRNVEPVVAKLVEESQSNKPNVIDTVKTVLPVKNLAEQKDLKLKPEFQENSFVPHAYAILVTKGLVDFAALKADFEKYNSLNFKDSNLKIAENMVDGKQLISIEMFMDANAAKYYLFGVIRNRNLFEALKGKGYRNLLISEVNKSELLRTDATTEYLKFNRSNYMR